MILAGEQPQAAHLLRSWAWIPPGVWIFVCCECCVLSGRGLCDELITRPEEAYRLVHRRVWCRNIKNRFSIYIYIYIYIYDITSLRVNDLILILLMWRKWWTRNNASKWQMGFNSAFKWLNKYEIINIYMLYCETVITSPYLGSPVCMFVVYKIRSNTSGK